MGSHTGSLVRHVEIIVRVRSMQGIDALSIIQKVDTRFVRALPVVAVFADILGQESYFGFDNRSHSGCSFESGAVVSSVRPYSDLQSIITRHECM